MITTFFLLVILSQSSRVIKRLWELIQNESHPPRARVRQGLLNTQLIPDDWTPRFTLDNIHLSRLIVFQKLPRGTSNDGLPANFLLAAQSITLNWQGFVGMFGWQWVHLKIHERTI